MYNPVNSVGPFLPVYQTFSRDPDQFLIQITEFYSNIVRSINFREISSYLKVELPTGEKWFNPNDAQNPREGFRQIFTTGVIAAGGTSSQAHGITGFTTLTFTHIYGTAITTAATFNQRPIPYSSATSVTNQIQVDVDNTNLRIINGATAPQITSAIIVLEYLKS